MPGWTQTILKKWNHNLGITQKFSPSEVNESEASLKNKNCKKSMWPQIQISVCVCFPFTTYSGVASYPGNAALTHGGESALPKSSELHWVYLLPMAWEMRTFKEDQYLYICMLSGDMVEVVWVNSGWIRVNYSLLLSIFRSSNLKYHQLICHLGTADG